MVSSMAGTGQLLNTAHIGDLGPAINLSAAKLAATPRSRDSGPGIAVAPATKRHHLSKRSLPMVIIPPEFESLADALADAIPSAEVQTLGPAEHPAFDTELARFERRLR